ncbi:glycosyltransferase family 4 protein [Turicibacter sanguinis]|uniref:glycosyltransferase family 4 protein n=1 Tax=Turicibacter sanguinis TaxID=154288 RepID=UPI0018A9CE54|nr:glycosyltransferase family 4 protein [Turicibacter sanguinis]
MRNILIYLDSMEPSGGIERVVSNLANQWRKKYRVIILTKDSKVSFYKLDDEIVIDTLNQKLQKNMGSKLHRIYSLIANYVLCRSKLRNAIKKYSPDFIYVTTPYNALEITTLNLKDINLIISEHGSKFGYNQVYNFLKKIIYPRANFLIVPTKMDTKLYLEDGYRAYYIPHITSFSASEQNLLDKKVILNIGRLTEDKRQLLLLKMWKEIVQENENIDWKLKIVGEGENKQKLEDYIKDNNLTANTLIVSPTHTIEDYFKECSIFAFTSRYEGFGMVLLEAMSFGIPSVAFNCPSGPRDIIEDKKDGYLVDENNLIGWKNSLLKLMSDSNNRIDMGNNAYKKAMNWNNSEILKLWDDIFMGGIK